eukprot:344408-Chlamydomonas_euryale.AAC.1
MFVCSGTCWCGACEGAMQAAVAVAGVGPAACMLLVLVLRDSGTLGGTVGRLTCWLSGILCGAPWTHPPRHVPSQTKSSEIPSDQNFPWES